MSDSELFQLSHKIDVVEDLLRKYNQHIHSFQIEFNTTLPNDSFYKILVRNLNAELNELLGKLSKANPQQLELVFS